MKKQEVIKLIRDGQREFLIPSGNTYVQENLETDGKNIWFVRTMKADKYRSCSLVMKLFISTENIKPVGIKEELIA